MHTYAENQTFIFNKELERPCFLMLFWMLLDSEITLGALGQCLKWQLGFLYAQTVLFVFLWLVQSAHLELMDALMAVGAMETVSTVLTSGGSELLGTDATWDRALLSWVNTVSLIKNLSNTVSWSSNNTYKLP